MTKALERKNDKPTLRVHGGGDLRHRTRVRTGESQEDQAFQYDVCLSFAGENRAYVERVAEQLKERGVRVFYDRWEEVQLWGKDLYEHLAYVYGKAARFCVLFVSQHYQAKVWPSHERRNAQARAIRQHHEYVLPVRFDDTEIPGLPDTIGYISLGGVKPQKLAGLILAKLGNWRRTDFLPPIPDRLYAALRIRDNQVGRMERAFHRAHHFQQSLRRMSDEERKTVLAFFLLGCHAELPENLHITTDFLRRITGYPTVQLRQLLGGVRSLGFVCRVRHGLGDSMRNEKRHHHETDELGSEEQFVMEYHDLHERHGGNSTADIRTMVVAASDRLCEDCAMKALMQSDFSQLSSATMRRERRAGRPAPLSRRNVGPARAPRVGARRRGRG